MSSGFKVGLVAIDDPLFYLGQAVIRRKNNSRICVQRQMGPVSRSQNPPSHSPPRQEERNAGSKAKALESQQRAIGENRRRVYGANMH